MHIFASLKSYPLCDYACKPSIDLNALIIFEFDQARPGLFGLDNSIAFRRLLSPEKGDSGY